MEKMREIKFRGKPVNSNKGVWAYGFYGRYYSDFAIREFIFEPRDHQWVEIQHNSVGQYTGLKDKNGKEIYEGDIVHCWSEHAERGRWEIYWRIDRWHLRRGEALWDNGDYYEGDEVYWDDAEVIGNIYENPELLK